ncbi:PREDICTED: uncharacterized protein LOC109588618, partial [Amphimedon queenslandica]|uniref:ZU5 domain-containing protein n=2 Tax=Amphimedon queenslandica TaxID=400682 RepID=A0AAN0JU04_AMPQE
MVMLFLMSLHLIAIAFATINTYDWLVSSTRLVGNKYPVLLMNSQRFNKSVANVEITLSFPSADSVSVYKVPCNSLRASSARLGPKHVVTNLLTNKISRTGFNFDNIPLNLAPGSTVTYSIANTLPLDSSSCISLVFINSAEAYDEFLYIQTNFTNYIFRSDCLTNGNTTVISFPVKDEQNDYYVGIESNISNANTDIITVSAEVSVVQVYYNLSNAEVYTSLSVNRTSCIVRMCETILCLDPHHVCVLVNSTSFNFISYSSHPDITTITSTSRVFGFLAIICAFFLTLFISSVSFGYCIKKKDAVRRKILSNRRGSIFLSIFIGIMIFEGVFIPIILSYSIKFYGKTWINNTKDFVLVNLDQTGFIKWVNTHDIAFSVETDSANSSDISLYTVSRSEAVPIPLANKSKIECKNFSSSCVLNESIYLVKAEENYVNYNISLFSNISGLPFRVSTFDDYEQYENFFTKKPYTPLQSSLFYGNETFNFNFSNIDMKQKAAYYHFVLHPAFQADVYTHTKYYYTNSSVQMESSMSHYKLNKTYRPHCNITKNSTSICRSSIKDNIRVVARANMLTKPVLLVATTTNVPLAVFVAVVPALVIIFVVLVIIVFAFIVRWKSSKGYQPLPTRSFKDGKLPEGQSTRQDDSEEQPGSEPELAREGQLARDSQQADELATDDKSAKMDDGSAKKDDELAKKDDELAKKDDQTNKPEGVAGTESFFIQNYAQLLNWEEYGLRITVPEGAVPPSETIEVSITALVGGEFILPEDSELVSVVYTITVSKPLLKPVLLEIQHCVSIETPSHANHLSFVASSNDHCRFEFQTVDKGSFPVGERLRVGFYATHIEA